MTKKLLATSKEEKTDDLDQVFTFDDQNRAIRIKRFDTPQAWINYLSNGTFHAFASQAGGGSPGGRVLLLAG